MAHDQVHEQLNAMVKGDGGVIGITENDETLRRWMIAGPEMASLLCSYYDKHSTPKRTDNRHHEQVPSVQKRFATDVKNVCREFEEIGNPFSDTSKDLYSLDKKQIMPDDVKRSVKSAEEVSYNISCHSVFTKTQHHSLIQLRKKQHSPVQLNCREKKYNICN